MRRDQLEHAIRTACQSIQQTEIIVVGSQAMRLTGPQEDQRRSPKVSGHHATDNASVAAAWRRREERLDDLVKPEAHSLVDAAQPATRHSWSRTGAVTQTNNPPMPPRVR